MSVFLINYKSPDRKRGQRDPHKIYLNCVECDLVMMEERGQDIGIYERCMQGDQGSPRTVKSRNFLDCSSVDRGYATP